jgi:hypothetical protein
MIEDLLENFSAPRSLVVVSSDHRVQRAARHWGAKFIDSEQWYAETVATRRQRNTLADDAAAKPSGKPTPEELAHWLQEFGDPPTPAGDSESPFPPGYADDLDENA